nr:histidine kinase [Microbacterium sp. CFBP 13617]
MLQFAAYPLLWVISSRRRTAIAWTALSSVLVLVALAWGGDGGAWERAAIIQATSFAGNIGLGLWFTAVYRHAAETQGLLDRLTAAQDELAALHRDTGVVEERGRLAAELHDTIAQTLAGTVLLVQRSRRELAAGVLADSTLGLVEEAARAALTETRTLVAGGAPVSHGEGLVAALTVLVDRLGRESGLRIDLRADAVTGLDRESEVALLRCAQEGLSNARRHSGARRVEVTLTELDDGVELRIADDGAGFHPAARAQGFGLEGLRARLGHLDGDLLIDGSPGATVLTARVPRAAVRA